MTEQLPDAPTVETLELLEYGTEEDLVSHAVGYAQTALPQWEPRAGNVELVLMESLALMLGVEVLAVQLLPNTVTEQLMGLYGITRDPGLPAKGRVEFTVTNSNPIQVVPAGTILRFIVEATGETVDVTTDESVSLITSETMSRQVDVTAELSGVVPNGVPAGTELEVVDNLPFVQSVTLVQGMSGGVGVEDDESFNARAASVLARLTSTLVSPDSFQYAALTEPGVGRAKVFDLYDPANPTVDSAGHISVAVADMEGGALTQDAMDGIHELLTAQALASLIIHVVEPTYTTVNLAVTVQATPGYTEPQVTAAVTAALETLIDPATWDWSTAVTQYGLIGVLAPLPGVKNVTSVPADQPLAGIAPLPVLGSLSVTVTA